MRAEWLPAYRALELYVLLQILEVVTSVSYYLYEGKEGLVLAAISRVLNGACILYGIKLLVMVAIDSAECTSLNSDERGEAKKCIDVYSSYATITGAGDDTACASLNVNTERTLGGVCPTVYLSSNGGALVHGFEIGTIVAFLALNASKMIMASRFLKSDGLQPPQYFPTKPVSAKPSPKSTPAQDKRPTVTQVGRQAMRRTAISSFYQ